MNHPLPDCTMLCYPRDRKYRTILLFGAPGCGKGTQGKILSHIPGFFHSSTGDIFRSLDLQSEMGRVFLEYSSRGELVPDDIVINIWKNYIKGMEMINAFHPESQFIVLDGLPRNVNQVELLKQSIDVVKIIYLRAEKEKMVERLRRRAMKESRPDDASDEVIRKRLAVFEGETRPVLDQYPPELVVRVDATMSMIRVTSEIVKQLVPLKESLDSEPKLPPAPVPAGCPGR